MRENFSQKKENNNNNEHNPVSHRHERIIEMR